MGVILFIVRKILPVNLYSIGLLVGLGAAIYTLTIYMLVGPSIVKDAKRVFNNLISKK